jgi:hypothetical protein
VRELFLELEKEGGVGELAMLPDQPTAFVAPEAAAGKSARELRRRRALGYERTASEAAPARSIAVS